MIAWACTLKQMRERIDAMIAVVGEDTPVAARRPAGVATSGMNENGKLYPVGQFVDECVQIECVFVNKETGRVVSDEANDYKPGPNERAAVKFS